MTIERLPDSSSDHPKSLDSHDSELTAVIESKTIFTDIPIDCSVDTIEEEEEKDDVNCVSSIIGSSGRWQYRFIRFYMIVYLISAFQNYGIVFYAARADFYCSDNAQVCLFPTLLNNLNRINFFQIYD